MSHWDLTTTSTRIATKKKVDNTKKSKRDKRKDKDKQEDEDDSKSSILIIPNRLGASKVITSSKKSNQTTPARSTDQPEKKNDFDIFNQSLGSANAASSSEPSPSQPSTSEQNAVIYQKEIQHAHSQADEDNIPTERRIEFIDNDPINLLSGITKTWRPPYWNKKLLIYKDLELRYTGTMDDFSKPLRKKNVIEITGQTFKDLITTTKKDTYWFSPEMTTMHEFRQLHNSITPLFIEISSSNGLPIDLHLISTCDFDKSTNTFVQDSCNQTFCVKKTAIGTELMKFLAIIPSGEKFTKTQLVTDFSKDYSPEAVKTIFLIQREEINACIHATSYNSNYIAYLKVGSHLERIIMGLSDLKNIAFKDIRPKAEALVGEMVVSEQKNIFNDPLKIMWYTQLTYPLLMDVKNFIENLSMTIPKYENLCFRIQPVPGVSWTDTETWSKEAIKRLGIKNLIQTESDKATYIERIEHSTTTRMRLYYL